jgi:hypothetical protein
MYYTIKVVDIQGVESMHEKINHVAAMNTINQLLLSYGFSKSITKNTFNNIITRSGILPDRLKFLINNNKLKVTRWNVPPPLNLQSLSVAMYGF